MSKKEKQNETPYVEVFLEHIKHMLAMMGGNEGTHFDKVYIDEDNNVLCQTPYLTLYAKSPWTGLGEVGIGIPAMKSICEIEEPQPIKKEKKIHFVGLTRKTKVRTSFSFEPFLVPVPCTETKRKDDTFNLNIGSKALRIALMNLLPFMNKVKAFAEYCGITIEGKTLRTYNNYSFAFVKTNETICKKQVTLPPFLCEYLSKIDEDFEASVTGNSIRFTFASGIVVVSPLVLQHTRSEKGIVTEGEQDILISISDTEVFRKEIGRIKKFSNLSTIHVTIDDQQLSLSSVDAAVGTLSDTFEFDTVFNGNNPVKTYLFQLQAEDFLNACGVVNRFKIFLAQSRMRGFGKLKLDDGTELKTTIYIPVGQKSE